jgi:hypothetical protein
VKVCVNANQGKRSLQSASPIRHENYSSIAEDRIRPARAITFAELISFLLSNPALLL